MYRLVLYGLGALALVSVVLGYGGILPYAGTALLLSLAILGAVAYATDVVAALLMRVTRNSESTYITSLILYFVLLPFASFADALILALGAFVAISSKYFFTYKNRHVFNPAAFAAVVLSLMGTGVVGWWVATPVLLPFVAVLGLLVVRKIRRFDLVLSFISVAVVAGVGYGILQGMSVLQTLSMMILSWPLVFFASFMLTEPLTAPTTRRTRIAYGALVGLLASVPIPGIGTRIGLPLALILGNIFTVCSTNTTRYTLTLVECVRIAATSWEFVFTSSPRLTHRAGQYMEWTLGHGQVDTRGNRRYFTIASAPEDAQVRVAVRIDENSSSFKRALMVLRPGDTMVATGVAGDFVLPADATIPMVWVAGGIGITPFMSMIRHMRAQGAVRDVILIYTARSEEEFAYQDELTHAQAQGVRVVQRVGRLTDEALREYVPDLMTRDVYLSGPDLMVRGLRSMVRALGVPDSRVHTDYFPGL